MFSWAALPARIVVVGHRGSAATAPENTLASFSSAIAARADAVELDVRLTEDNEVVVMHDARLQRTTNGKGKVSERSLEYIRSLSAGMLFGEQFAEERVPTLDEVFQLVRGRVGVNVEFKQEGTIPNLELLRRTLSIIKNHRAERYTMLSSFNHALIRHVRNYNRTIITGVLQHPFKPFYQSPVQQTKRAGAQFFITSKKGVMKKTCLKLHTNNLCSGIYTVNSEKELAKMIRYGVDCIISNNPAAIRRMLQLYYV